MVKVNIILVEFDEATRQLNDLGLAEEDDGTFFVGPCLINPAYVSAIYPSKMNFNGKNRPVTRITVEGDVYCSPQSFEDVVKLFVNG